MQGGCLETQNSKNTLKSPRCCQSLLVESGFGMRSRVFTQPGSFASLSVEGPASEGEAEFLRVDQCGGDDLGTLLGGVGVRASGAMLLLQPTRDIIEL